jgi:hypothetical protein
VDLMLTGFRPDTRDGTSAHRGVDPFLPGQASSPLSERDAHNTQRGFRGIGEHHLGSVLLLLTLVGLQFRLEFMAAGGTTSGSTAPGGALRPGPPPGFPVPPPPPRRGRALLAGVGITLAIALAAAALVMSLVSAHRNGTPIQTGQSGSRPTTQAASATDDRAVCEAIAPLIKEAAADGKAFVALGNSGTPARDAGIDGFAAKTADWVKRTQAVVDQHVTTARPDYLMRSLQRFIDDRRAYASNIRPGPATDGDTAAWNDSIVAVDGLAEVCGGLGVPLW